MIAYSVDHLYSLNTTLYLMLQVPHSYNFHSNQSHYQHDQHFLQNLSNILFKILSSILFKIFSISLFYIFFQQLSVPLKFLSLVVQEIHSSLLLAFLQYAMKAKIHLVNSLVSFELFFHLVQFVLQFSVFFNQMWLFSS